MSKPKQGPVIASLLLLVGLAGGLFFGHIAYVGAQWASLFRYALRNGQPDAWLTFWHGLDHWKFVLLYGAVSAAFSVLATSSLIALVKASRTGTDRS